MGITGPAGRRHRLCEPARRERRRRPLRDLRGRGRADRIRPQRRAATSSRVARSRPCFGAGDASLASTRWPTSSGLPICDVIGGPPPNSVRASPSRRVGSMLPAQIACSAAASRVARSFCTMAGSRSTRAIRDRARRWSAPAVSGARRRKIRSTGWPSIASKSIGRSRRANRPNRRLILASLPCGIAMPLPTPVDPRRSRCRRMSKISRSPTEVAPLRSCRHLLQDLLLGVHFQRRDDRVQRRRSLKGIPSPLRAWDPPGFSGCGLDVALSSVRPRPWRRR